MSNFISEQLEKSMTRKQFLQMAGAMLLAVFGIQNLINIFQRHANAGTSPVSLLDTSSTASGFGSRKFGQ